MLAGSIVQGDERPVASYVREGFAGVGLELHLVSDKAETRVRWVRSLWMMVEDVLCRSLRVVGPLRHALSARLGARSQSRVDTVDAVDGLGDRRLHCGGLTR